MAGPAGLRLWPWLGPAVLLHVAALEWMARESVTITALQPMGEVMYTRMLQPAPPPPIAAPPPATGPAVPQGVLAVSPPRPMAAASGASSDPAPRDPKPAAKPRAPDSAAQNKLSGVAGAPQAPPAAANGQASPEAAEPESFATAANPELAGSAAVPQHSEATPPATAETAATPGMPAAAAAPGLADSAAAAVVASAAAPSAATSARPQGAADVPPAQTASAADSWPGDTRLNYRLGGQFRSGQIYGDARVLWQREGTRYQVQVDLDITLFARMIITSQGEVTPEGLQPQTYEEVRPGRKRRAASFGREQVVLDNGSNAPRPPGMQDAASQFVELAHRFATGRETLAAGRTVDLWLGRPGGVDLWTYDVLGLETLHTPGFGAVQAWRLKPRPISKPRGKVTAEMWFAPSLQYLPVRIRIWTGDDAVIDLVAQKIEQR